ncbi:GNAT family N-acetyltransferase [Gilliamella sp. B14448G11]|nr:GNAT family N-acetyltransferase [Gilliamella sp. B14448G7]MBI0035175.1 GNAT family N-acetyltransferase [Gilliamella sp. B14448G11]MBI0042435.1 GNAT family N-acetyltransferase [Gilliamella sp. B14448G12]
MFKLEWAKNLCNNFNSYFEFVEIGLGFIVLKYNVIFSKALSYLVYNDSIEVDTLYFSKRKRKGTYIDLFCKFTFSLFGMSSITKLG